jgi:hypothetical protein
VLRNEEEEEFMARSGKNRLKTIIDLEKLNRFNDEGCPACGRKFTLGEPVVLACGAWEGKPKYIHENEAIFDEATSTEFQKIGLTSRRSFEKATQQHPNLKYIPSMDR